MCYFTPQHLLAMHRPPIISIPVQRRVCRSRYAGFQTLPRSQPTLPDPPLQSILSITAPMPLLPTTNHNPPPSQPNTNTATPRTHYQLSQYKISNLHVLCSHPTPLLPRFNVARPLPLPSESAAGQRGSRRESCAVIDGFTGYCRMEQCSRHVRWGRVCGGGHALGSMGLGVAVLGIMGSGIWWGKEGAGYLW